MDEKTTAKEKDLSLLASNLPLLGLKASITNFDPKP
jgi:hypothetical protein